MQPDYSIHILEYAVIPEQTSEAAYSGYVYQGQTRRFPFSFVLVRGGGSTVLVDCGINFASPTKHAMAEGFGLQNCHSPAEVLAGVGLAPEDIDIIIPTHGHWDHMGSLELFPRATVYLQRAEAEGWRELLKRSEKYAALVSAVDRADFEILDVLAAEGRLVLLDGEARDVLPGIHIWVEVNGHTHASQLVLVESQPTGGSRDDYIVVGDVAYTADNLTGVPEFPHYIPNTKWSIGGPYTTLKMYDRILDYVDSDLDRILIEHDEETWTRHPTRTLANGLRVAEVRLADGHTSPMG